MRKYIMFNIDTFVGNYQTEFPEFILDFSVPTGFKDVSSDCDACPSWMDLELCLFFMADFTDPKLSESGGAMPRFYLAYHLNKNSMYGTPLWEFDSNEIETIYDKIGEIKKEINNAR